MSTWTVEVHEDVTYDVSVEADTPEQACEVAERVLAVDGRDQWPRRIHVHSLLAWPPLCKDGHRPDDEEPSEVKCKDCWRLLAWVGPGLYDWEVKPS